MPRTNTNTKQTEFYRLLVESFYDGEWHETMYYGPYINRGGCRATIDGAEHYFKDRYEKGTRRSRVQKQKSFINREPHSDGASYEAYIEWVDVA